MPVAKTEDLLPLSEVVQELRTQLAAAVEQGRGEHLRFKLNTIELEFTVVAKREAGGDGKLKFSVLGFGVEAGAGGKAANEQTQKIKLSLTPLPKPGTAASSTDDDATVLINRKPARKAQGGAKGRSASR
jgi:hypothetical protein